MLRRIGTLGQGSLSVAWTMNSLRCLKDKWKYAQKPAVMSLLSCSISLFVVIKGHTYQDIDVSDVKCIERVGSVEY